MYSYTAYKNQRICVRWFLYEMNLSHHHISPGSRICVPKRTHSGMTGSGIAFCYSLYPLSYMHFLFTIHCSLFTAFLPIHHPLSTVLPYTLPSIKSSSNCRIPSSVFGYFDISGNSSVEIFVYTAPISFLRYSSSCVVGA